MTIEEFAYDHPDRDVAAFKRAVANKLIYAVGKDPVAASPDDWLNATALAVRDQLVERWMATTRASYAQDLKRVYYLSMEFLIGRTFTNALLALELQDIVKQALADFGVDIAAIAEREPDAALGNGGLGRLAACFLDSMATLGVPGFGYGIRYEYGMFRQKIVDGQQVETPDYWLTRGNPWEFQRPEVTYRVRFGGHVQRREEATAGGAADWVDTHDVLAVAYDTIIPGYGTQATNTLRLWSARATEEIDLSAFNRGNYMQAVESKNHSENVSRVLYPDDSTASGRELRLHQEYFFVSASVQDLLRRYLRTHTTFDKLPEKVSIHLNDTHPVLAVPELMRLLLDEHGLGWDSAWAHTQKVFSYTNHTLMHEALETWPVEMMGRILPRHLQILYEMNSRFLATVTQKLGHDVELLRRLSLIDETGERRVRMAYVAVLASHSINGVSGLHSELMKQSIFADFNKIFPERFNNKTNGVTPRRWLAQANPPLASLLDQRIGRGWRRDLTQLEALRPMAQQAPFVRAFRHAKRENKLRLANWIEQHMGIVVDTDAMFDVQVKRIHEYKRQLLNVLHVVSRYQRIVAAHEAGQASDLVPRVVVFAGKAASAYHAAKLVIRLINDVAAVVNNDPRVGKLLKVVFLPNYSVSLAEIIMPAADLSEQISTAGTEASGTGNMKFALNGALTIGTLDGANVEMKDNVGDDNIFIFGNTTPQVADIRASGYQPRTFYESNLELQRVLDAIRDGVFSPGEPARYQGIFDTLVNWGDQYLLLADYASYVATQARVDALYRDADAWTRMAILNVAGMGAFSSDRTIAEYAHQIWHTKPVALG
ncbi:glycogen/starch/alpha-glucan phosphorylase [Variovorax arabinosiphilus]|uniref:glycogen/starch/alpha-glucan phosphorylase n=1 Tax=Variovorax arabinosiphilus TaxID=3053498 RepID=UPI0025780B85|nr:MULTISPECIES: glycogen/starch/alpha-glucan phosphorylase [unclassified Variovorax]MDM0122002.1 glycogen/starch/alpha-glucan phosphorylase [Variovorax sp. J2L1-78]MDM0131468.1 glycogen/starch/alpha-glucan phosphorylase [Variovorax sp. J2L1-63]MDM0234765.1 glycogen/starch/alpha-glucan phosphorylase [Variovorax sp. J2R1-6]